MLFRFPPSPAVRVVLPLVTVAALASGCSGDQPLGSGYEAPTSEQTAPTAAPSAAAPAGSAPAASAPTTAGATAGGAPAAAGPTMTIKGFEYDVPDSVPAGSTIEVVNEDTEAHTVTFRGGTSTTVPGRGVRTLVTAPAKPGTYQIVCDFHGGMTAQLTVTPA